MAPQKTAGMLNFEHQLDKVFPQRKKPDGWIADEFHTGTSSHHPDDTPGSKPEWDGDPDTIQDVRAIDVWSEFGSDGPTGMQVCNHLVQLNNLGSVIRYIIHDGYMWHSNAGFVRKVYTGSNKHEHHIHVTFAFTEAADDNTTYNYHLEDLVALTQDDKNWILANIRSADIGDGKTLGGSVNALVTQGVGTDDDPTDDYVPATSTVGRLVGNQGIPNPFDLGSDKAPLYKVLGDIARSLLRVEAALAEVNIQIPDSVLTRADVEASVKDALRAGTES